MFLSYSGRILQLRTVITAETTSSVSGDNCRVNSRNTVFRLQSNPAGMCDWPPCWIWRCRWTCISWPESSALAPDSNERGGVFFFFFFFFTQSQSRSERGLRGRIVQKWTWFFGKNWAGLRGSSCKVLWVGYQLGHVERHWSKNPPDMFHIKTTPGEKQ